MVASVLRHVFRSQTWLVGLVALVWVGCATTKVNWDARVGQFTYDQAVVEMGPPDRSAKLTDGALVAEWLTMRGYRRGTVAGYFGPFVNVYEDPPMPDQYLRLSFSPEGKLQTWKRVSR